MRRHDGGLPGHRGGIDIGAREGRRPHGAGNSAGQVNWAPCGDPESHCVCVGFRSCSGLPRPTDFSSRLVSSRLVSSRLVSLVPPPHTHTRTRAHAPSLSASVSRLLDGITGSLASVLASHSAVVGATQETFGRLARALLPGKEVALLCVDARGDVVTVDRGGETSGGSPQPKGTGIRKAPGGADPPQLAFGHRPLRDWGGAGGGRAASDSESESGPPGSKPEPLWRTSLTELSGGQRALVSLALLLAAASCRGAGGAGGGRGGGPGRGLAILDEADAALDEVNQGRLAALLRRGSAPRPAGATPAGGHLHREAIAAGIESVA